MSSWDNVTGRTLVVHANPNGPYLRSPGERVACGVISLSEWFVRFSVLSVLFSLNITSESLSYTFVWKFPDLEDIIAIFTLKIKGVENVGVREVRENLWSQPFPRVIWKSGNLFKKKPFAACTVEGRKEFKVIWSGPCCEDMIPWQIPVGNKQIKNQPLHQVLNQFECYCLEVKSQCCKMLLWFTNCYLILVSTRSFCYAFRDRGNIYMRCPIMLLSPWLAAAK